MILACAAMGLSGARGQGVSPSADVSLVSDLAADAAARSDAARRLLLADNDGARQSVSELLAPGESGALTDAQRLLVGEIARLSWAPGRLGGPLRALLAASKGDDRAAVIGALGSVRTPASARALIEAAEKAGPGAERDAAFAALARMTGRTDLGSDAAAWHAWFARMEFLDEGAWQRSLAEGLAARADQLARANEQGMDRLVREKRDRFRAIPPEDLAGRSRYIAGLLSDPAGAVRTLGVELANDELANARTPGPVVSEAALAMLSDPEARFRRMGADLLEKLAPDGYGSRVNDALLRETDPAAAAALLGAAKRWPEQRIVPVVLRWLEDGPGARTAALSAIVKLDRAGLLTDEANIRRAMQAVRGLRIDEMGASGVQLLARRGRAADLEWVSGLLKHEDIGIRMAAAEGLAGRAEGVDPLLRAASDDPSFFTAAAAALTQFRPTEEGLRTLLGLPAPSVDVRIERIRAMAAVLPPGVICDVGCEEQDAATREVILARLSSAAQLWADQRPWVASARSPSWLRGVLELAQTRLSLGRPAEALEALQPLDSLAMETSLTAPVRVTAMIWLNRLDEAAACPTSAEVWVSALERVAGLPHAAAALARFDALYGAEDLDAGLSARVAKVREQLRQLAGSTAGPSGAAASQGGGPP